MHHVRKLTNCLRAFFVQGGRKEENVYIGSISYQPVPPQRMHSPKLLHRVCSGTKQASVGPDCVSNLGVNSGEREHTAGMKLSVRICVSLVRHTHTLSPQWQLDPETVMAERT